MPIRTRRKGVGCTPLGLKAPVVSAALPTTSIVDSTKAGPISSTPIRSAKVSLVQRTQTLRTGAGTQKDYDAAQAALRQAKAQVNSSQTRLARRSIASPVTGTVEQVYYRPGEVVAAAKPIVALLPPGNIKIRFFVLETTLGEVLVACLLLAKSLGQEVAIAAVQPLRKAAHAARFLSTYCRMPPFLK